MKRAQGAFKICSGVQLQLSQAVATSFSDGLLSRCIANSHLCVLGYSSLERVFWMNFLAFHFVGKAGGDEWTYEGV